MNVLDFAHRPPVRAWLDHFADTTVNGGAALADALGTPTATAWGLGDNMAIADDCLADLERRGYATRGHFEPSRSQVAFSGFGGTPLRERPTAYAWTVTLEGERAIRVAGANDREPPAMRHTPDLPCFRTQHNHRPDKHHRGNLYPSSCLEPPCFVCKIHSDRTPDK